MLQLFDVSEIKVHENYITNSSPTSEAMKNSLDRIGNPNPRLKVKADKITDFGRRTVSRFMEPLRDASSTKVGKKPCARDGHATNLYGDKLVIFGGDRHKMSFNDIYTLNL